MVVRALAYCTQAARYLMFSVLLCVFWVFCGVCAIALSAPVPGLICFVLAFLTRIALKK